MKKGLIFYASQSGSTRKVAQLIRDGLAEEGCSVDLYDIAHDYPSEVSDYDFIGIGSPTYMFRPSYAVLDYLDRLGNLSGMKVFSFITYGSEIGDGGNWLRRKLDKMGGVSLGQYCCTGRHLFPGYTSRGYIFSPNGPTNQELRDAFSFGRQIASTLRSENFPNQIKSAESTHFISRLERFLTNRSFIRLIYSRFFRSDYQKCTSCGTCCEVCPTGNIKMGVNGNLYWERRCILCCSCQIHCPRQAVSTPLSWFVFAPFLAYNIRRTKKKIEYEKL